MEEKQKRRSKRRAAAAAEATQGRLESRKREEETGGGEEVNKLRGASFHSTVIAHPTFSPPPLSRAFAPRSLSPARALSVYTYIVEKWSA